jgi:hypothetical protein
MQIRTLVARIVMRFDISFAPGENGAKLVEQSRDHFTLGLEDLNLEFKRAQWVERDDVFNEHII